ncbi:DNA translocase FtsK [Ectobacillus polymachus]|uniref:DNA translocase FtsK n=1 Tax=Ectobacillus polymachus TaxID=1508806 RepID=UPI003A89EA15
MLDWMKKLINKEDPISENSSMFETEQVVQMETSRESSSYPNGKFRFPLIHDDKVLHPNAESRAETRKVEQKREQKSQVEKPISNIKPDVPPLHASHKQERASAKQIKSNDETRSNDETKSNHTIHKVGRTRKSFQPTETVSPIFGYKRPNKNLLEKQPSVDLVLSTEQMSVVDAWLYKNGYLTLEKTDEMNQGNDLTSELHNDTDEIVERIETQKIVEEREQLEADMIRSEATEEPEAEQSIMESEATEEPEAEQPVMESEAIEEPEAEQSIMESEATEEPEAEPPVIESEATEEQEAEQPVMESEATEEPEAEQPVMESEAIEEQEAEQPIMESEAIEEQEAEQPIMESEATEEQEAEPPVIESEATEEQEAEPPVMESEATEEPEAEQPVMESEAIEEQEAEQPVIESEATEEQEVMEAAEDHAVESEAVRNYEEVKETKREKKRYVPFNVVMLHQDKRKLSDSVPSDSAPNVKSPSYTFPSLGLLEAPNVDMEKDEEWLSDQEQLLNTTFDNFHIGAKVVNVTQGPAVTRFEVQPDPGVKVNKITNLSDDIKLNLAARDIRIEAPIPGKNTVGIEVPNRHSKPVFLREILRSSVFTKSESPMTVALGLDISGMPIVTDLRKMPHGLIAGATGSGKSVCINAILTSILYKALPDEVKLLLIDPKMVELAPYNDVPHLVSPVITDVKAATAALKWAVDEMEHRYELFAHAGARDLTRYNDLVNSSSAGQPLPYIVIVIDELADLMMVSPADVEEAICRIAQKARACGIHLLVATQRPSVDVITGLIKANIPTRLAFTVSSQVDSRTIIDISGAEKLLGRGDMLFLENGTSKPIRLQGVYVSDDEIERTVGHVRKELKPQFLFKQDDLLAKVEQNESGDELFIDACKFVLDQGGASTSSLQRRFRIGYNRAARLIEEMELQGIVSENRGTKPRDVLISEEELEAMQDYN